MPASDSSEDIQAAQRFDAIANRMILDPLYQGRYPDEMEPFFQAIDDGNMADDLKVISVPTDFLGVNYYSRSVVKHDPAVPMLELSEVHPVGNEYSMMWEIYPQVLYELLLRTRKDYIPSTLLITENGVPVPDDVDQDGRIRDERRIRYLRNHLIQVHKAMAAGVPIQGYFVWSLLDNYEWALGYRPRFGLIHVDFDTQNRIIKDSGQWFSRIANENRLELDKDIS